MAVLKQLNIIKTDLFQDQTNYIESNLAIQVKVLALGYCLAWPQAFWKQQMFYKCQLMAKSMFMHWYLWIANTCCLQAKQCFYLFAYFWSFNHSTGCCKSHLVTIICWNFVKRKVAWLMKSDTQRLLCCASRLGEWATLLNWSLTFVTF